MRLVLGIFLLIASTVITQAETGIASWYSDTRTASGERFNPKAMTCAHKTLKFGTVVTITGDNGKSIKCRINDRGPYVKGRIIDLTRGAAQRLGMLQRGLMKVTLTT